MSETLAIWIMISVLTAAVIWILGVMRHLYQQHIRMMQRDTRIFTEATEQLQKLQRKEASYLQQQDQEKIPDSDSMKK